MTIEWPNRATIPAAEFAALLERVPGDELAVRFDIGVDLVEHWSAHGVPAGNHAALIRYFADTNRIALVPTASCLLCGAPAGHEIGRSNVCDACALDPVAALEGLGYETEMISAESHTGLRVQPDDRFEAPLRASFGPTQHSMLGTVADPEIGHPAFDAAVHIETDDYEALFDVLQHARRRELVQMLSREGVVTIDVDEASFWYKTSEQTVAAVTHSPRSPRVMQTSPLDIRRYWLRLGLLTWSLVNERSPHR